MPWITVADSQIGDREDQQDRYLVVTSRNGKSLLLAVADGAGGHTTGALAAEAAINCIKESLAFLWTCDEPDAFINKLITECNERVMAVGGDELACTTLVIVFLRDDEIFWGHVGDSRFYLIRNREVIVKTTDHSMIELQKQQAQDQSEVVVSNSSSKLYMCLGALRDITPQVDSSLAKQDDTLLLCSDGLWGQLNMQSLIPELYEKPLTEESLNSWIKKAETSRAGSSDNITLVVAKYLDRPDFLSNPLKWLINLFRK